MTLERKSKRPPNISIAVRTLVSGGFVLDGAKREPGYMLLFAYRYDEFGTKQKYCFALAEDTLVSSQISGAKIAAEHRNAQLIIIGDCKEEVPKLYWSRFINLFGGPIYSTHPLESSFREQLISLGYNTLPEGLEGIPNDLFEIYVQVAFEFIFAGRVIRYGQERLFEARADGLAIPSQMFTALYDAKAYKDGYEVTKDSIRQFSSYIAEFQQKYSAYLPRLNTFVVVSGNFPHRPDTLENRSRDLLSECGVPLAFLTARDLAQIIEIVREVPSYRRSINWARIFTEPIVTLEPVISEIEAIKKDGIIPTSSKG